MVLWEPLPVPVPGTDVVDQETSLDNWSTECQGGRLKAKRLVKKLLEQIEA